MKGPRFLGLIYWSVVVLLMLPLLTMLISSLLSQTKTLTMEWYDALFQDAEMMAALGRSLGLACASALTSVILATLAALGLRATGRHWLGTCLRSILQASLAMPELVFALSLLFWFSRLQIDLTLGTVLIAHVTFSLAFALLTIETRLQKMPPELEEAASDLGASYSQFLCRVQIPWLFPAIAAAFFLCFLLSFDDFLITYFVNGIGSDTLPVKLYTQMRTGLTPKLHALATTMLIISSGVLVLLHRALRTPSQPPISARLDH